MNWDLKEWLVVGVLLAVLTAFCAACDYFGIEVKPLGPDSPLFWGWRK